MKSTLVLLWICLLFSKPPVAITESTAQRFSAGTPDGGSGTKYSIQMIASYGSDEMSVEAFWVDSTCLDFNIFTLTNNKSFVKGDTLIIKANSYFHQPKGSQKKINPGPAPDYNGRALIIFNVKQRLKSVEIEQFTKLSALYFP
jgi:hypothetical protein